MFDIPVKVKKILTTLNDKGYKAYLVGGAVRDMIMGKKPHDFDITTDAEPEKVREIFPENFPLGIKFGTVTVVMDGEQFEVTTFRCDSKNYSDSRHPDSISYSDSLEEDLSRRDFTMNAIAMDKDGNIVDPFGGKNDIEKKIIRCVGDPEKRFKEDALRILRAIRFACTLDFEIDKDAILGIQKNNRGIFNVSADRVREELTKVLVSDNPDKGLKLLNELESCNYCIPELKEMFECKQNSPYCIGDVGTHTLKVICNVPKEPIIRWASLLHDVGKPQAKTTDKEGVDKFIGHAEISFEKSKQILRRLHFSNADAKKILDLVYLHDIAHTHMSKIRSIAAKYGEEFVENLHYLQIADARAHSPKYSDALVLQKENFYASLKSCLNDRSAITIADLHINGIDLINEGLCDKEIGDCLKYLHHICLGSPELNTREMLIKQVGVWKKQYLRKR